MEQSSNVHPLAPRSMRLRRLALTGRRPPQRQRGVTLMELVVTMAIVGILASIAIPSYNSYVLRSHRTDARTALLDMAALEERYFSVNNAYTGAIVNLGYTGAFPVTVGSGGGYYQIIDPTPLLVAAAAPTAVLLAGTPASYTLTAVPIGTQVKDTQCTSLTLTSAGVKGSTGTVANDPACWN